MSKKISRWLKSRTGKLTLGAVVLVLVAVAIIGVPLGWWEGLGGGITGTAGLPSPNYPTPVGGYTCMPTCVENDGKFLANVGEDMASFGGESIILWLSVPGDKPDFEIGIFDGDSSEDDTGAINQRNGNWDTTLTESTYTLFADPLKNGEGSKVVARWNGNQDPMPNNAWFNQTLSNDAQAKGPSGHYYYRIEATRPAQGRGINAFKLRSTGYLSTGKSNLKSSNFGLLGMLATLKDVYILYPEFQGDYKNLGPSTYNGEWQFYFYLPNDVEIMSIWDGDFDHGTSATVSPDTKDPNTNGKPEWAGPFAVEERAAGKGAPPDDYPNPVYTRVTPVWYQFLDPEGFPIYENKNPSGTEEWENFVVSTNRSVDADLYTDSIKPGYYNMHIQGLDLHNPVWVRVDYEFIPATCDGPCTPPPVWPEGACPRTIGYWKNNVKKVLIDGKTNGVQESRETLEWGLNNVALASPLFRSGINVSTPAAIGTAARLTDQEANMILQREKKNYPGDANSMLARALQQNLAAWLNLGTGKIGPTTVVTLNVKGGYFEGTIMEALEEAQNIILNGGDLERAKDIGDQINNGLLGENAETSACGDETATNNGDYEQTMPKDKQPPKHDKMPKAPKQQEPPSVTVPPPPDTNTCGARSNTYGVESPTNNPFYGIKFEYKSGTEIKDGDQDIFEYVLTQEQATAMTAVNMEAKAGGNVGQVTLTGCQFDGPLACGEPVRDENMFFAFYFLGATDNGDGTLTLKFSVQNFTSSGLSHATIGLPDGVVPPSPTNTYTNQVCP